MGPHLFELVTNIYLLITNSQLACICDSPTEQW